MSRRGFAPESIGTSAVLIGAVALGPISTDLYLPSVPWIGRDLGADVAATQLTLSVFLAAFAIAQIPVGPLSDRFGRRPVLLIGLAIYVLASVACAVAPSIEMLILARAVQAIGACAGVVLGRAIVRDIYGRDRAARMLAYIGSAMALAPMVGPILGGAVQSAFGWRWNFGILTTFGIVALALAWRGLAESNVQRDASALDPVRMAENFGRLLRHRAFLGFALTVAFSYAGLFAFISGSSFVLIDALGVATEHFGFFFAMGVIGYIAGTQIAGRLTMRMGIARMVWLGGTISLAGGAAMVALTPAAAGTVWAAFAVALPMACYMVGTGILMPNAQAGALGPFAQMAGAASALMGFLQTAIAAAVGIVFGQIHDGTPLPMALLVAAAACCSLASFALLARRPS
ncbi:MAG TPA: multidrug effflux MFS transporter [Alphaproteobacteria bacterium]|nr:multidrug effflux MFS transporter [Alphaproteobacteria bacterium]